MPNLSNDRQPFYNLHQTLKVSLSFSLSLTHTHTLPVEVIHVFILKALSLMYNVAGPKLTFPETVRQAQPQNRSLSVQGSALMPRHFPAITWQGRMCKTSACICMN